MSTKYEAYLLYSAIDMCVQPAGVLWEPGSKERTVIFLKQETLVFHSFPAF